MTETNRTITGLGRRPSGGARAVTGDLSGLRARNRTDAAVQRNGATPGHQTPASSTSGDEKTKKKSITVYVAPEVFKQARVAFNATRTVESDLSWSHFVEKALAAEAHRRAVGHNNGESFQGEDAPLAPGRPLADD